MDTMVTFNCWGRKKKHPDSYRFNRSQSKRRRKLIIAVRKRGYTSKEELKPHLHNINNAVRNHVAYTLPQHNPAKQRRRVPKPEPTPEPTHRHGYYSRRRLFAC